MADKDFLISQEMVCSLFEYRDGKLFNKVRRGNAAIGDEACALDAKGYKRTKINRKNFFVHRLIFLMHHGYMPQFIDHIDCDRTNNQIENLREATHTQNNHNRKISTRNKSGVKGVSWCNRPPSWKAQGTVNYRQYHLGYFSKLEDAEAAVRQFRSEHHAEFARQK